MGQLWKGEGARDRRDVSAEAVQGRWADSDMARLSETGREEVRECCPDPQRCDSIASGFCFQLTVTVDEAE